MVSLLLFGFLMTLSYCGAREINVAGLITTHAEFNTQQNLEILIFEKQGDGKAQYSICDLFPTEARFITTEDIVCYTN